MQIIVDSNVILDIFTQDDNWFNWSNQKLEELTNEGHTLIINPIIYTEVSIGFNTKSDFEAAIEIFNFKFENLTNDALFIAGKAFLKYKTLKGNKSNVLPDFFIGAHAESNKHTILSRDSARYKTYFPKVKLIAP
jgi:predicted nucleic acid-binding protein